MEQRFHLCRMNILGCMTVERGQIRGRLAGGGWGRENSRHKDEGEVQKVHHGDDDHTESKPHIS